MVEPLDELSNLQVICQFLLPGKCDAECVRTFELVNEFLLLTQALLD